MGKGYEDLVRQVQKDCESDKECFNFAGCIFSESKKRDLNVKCYKGYCDKLRWIIERAKHYEEKTGVEWESIIDIWQEKCDYWYMNYYCDNNQPLLEGNKTRVFNSVAELKEAIGTFEFVCPACGGITTDPYECNSGITIIKATKKKPSKICNWKVYGLLGDLGEGIFVFCKDKMIGQKIFMPLNWLSDEAREKIREKNKDI